MSGIWTKGQKEWPGAAAIGQAHVSAELFLSFDSVRVMFAG